MKFKKVTALALCVAMSATALAGCGSKAATTDSQTAAPAESTAADAADATEATEAAPVETKDVTLKVWAPQEDQNPNDTYDKGMLAAMKHIRNGTLHMNMAYAVKTLQKTK